MDWSKLYPQKPENANVEFADIGCGYGGLLGTILDSNYNPSLYYLSLSLLYLSLISHVFLFLYISVFG